MNLNWSILARARRIATSQVMRLTGQPELGQVLPDFLVIGAMKAGTTTLFAALTQHPHVIRSRRREIHFFGSRFGRGEVWYRRHFPTGLELRRHHAITGEGSTSYLAHPLAPERIHQVIPEIKMIALLRDPVDRAISNYFHEQRTGRETLPIVEAFAAEDERLRRAAEEPGQRPLGRLAYRKRGLYAEQLARYLHRFRREQLLVLRAESLFEGPRKTIDQVCRFLSIDPAAGNFDYIPKNIGGYNPSLVPPSLVDELTQFYASHNERVYALVGQDWGWKRER
jgi:hypothetical protein